MKHYLKPKIKDAERNDPSILEWLLKQYRRLNQWDIWDLAETERNLIENGRKKRCQTLIRAVKGSKYHYFYIKHKKRVIPYSHKNVAHIPLQYSDFLTLYTLAQKLDTWTIWDEKIWYEDFIYIYRPILINLLFKAVIELIKWIKHGYNDYRIFALNAWDTVLQLIDQYYSELQEEQRDIKSYSNDISKYFTWSGRGNSIIDSGKIQELKEAIKRHKRAI